MPSVSSTFYGFNDSDTVLFVGEGNFSFSSCLLKLLSEDLGISEFTHVFVTCFQKEISSSALENVNYLRNIGAEVFLDIDATKLEIAPRISSFRFDKIIFNFPHVGGKMKIHLNRELLRNFFISASKIIKTSGHVVVTLCSGQGGTGFDPVKRRWDDSWKIVEQAAHGSFILSQAEYFPLHLFPDYVPNGYRGRDQMFHTQSAIVHVFRKIPPPDTTLTSPCLDDIQNFHFVNEDLKVSNLHKFAFNYNPLKSCDSPQSLIARILSDHLNNVNYELETNDTDKYTIEYDDSHAQCIVNGQKHSLRSSLLEVIPPNHLKCNNFFSSGLVFKKCSSDFSDLCVRCHCVVVCPLDTIKSFISNIVSQFKFDGEISEEVENSREFKIRIHHEKYTSDRICWGNLETNVFTFDLDVLCSFIFKVSICQLWCRNVKLDLTKNVLILPSLYPLEFTHDISFASKSTLDFNDLYHCLHQLPDNLIKRVEFVSSYNLTESNEISYCFRITYKSYSKPLHKKLAIEYHEKFVGKVLTNILDVRIR